MRVKLVKLSDEGLESTFCLESSDRSIELTSYRISHGDRLVFECKAQNISSAVARFGAKCEGSKIDKFLLVGGRGQWVEVPIAEIEEIRFDQCSSCIAQNSIEVTK